jgi:glucoamylase
VVKRTQSQYEIWRFNHKCHSVSPGKTLRIELLAPATVHWSSDGWSTVRDADARDTGLGVYLADLPTADLAEGAGICFTFFWPEADRWEGVDFDLQVGNPDATRPAGPRG